MTTPLTESQRAQLAAWLSEGLKLSDIQKRLETEYQLRLTYLEVKLLIGDLQLMPKDQEPPKTDASGVIGAPAVASPAPTAPPPPGRPPQPAAAPPDRAPAAGAVRVSVDEISRPGALVSGKVVFSDGQNGAWYMDQMGRLGLAPEQKGYRPSGNDMQEFQVALDQQLARLGY